MSSPGFEPSPNVTSHYTGWVATDIRLYGAALRRDTSFRGIRIRRKHIFVDGSKDVQLFYEDDLRRTMFTSIDRVNGEIRERFQQLQNLAQKYAFFKA
ncbi:hypothetical protein TNCV_1940161 [Trichonephila clavipes]|nr:hypothetical protein TNCV_1940161 [Trichonephila clavipes]